MNIRALISLTFTPSTHEFQLKIPEKKLKGKPKSSRRPISPIAPASVPRASSS